ncbi:MAG TPA: RNA pyrophosphohydrolase [Methylocella sp.]|nr:RNA pyrophosphohydrolase [Methylocella sp.]
MPKSFYDLTPAALTELLKDPIVQMAMRADHVTQQQLMALIGPTLRNIAAKSKNGAAAGKPELGRMVNDYRPSVGIMLLNSNNEVLVGRRRDTKFTAWQMPQGGIEEGEDPRTAALRELKEEVGIDNAAFLAETKNWLHYDLPEVLINEARHGGWRGQCQKWVAMRFTGSNADIDISNDVEFCDWKWVPMEQLPDLIVPFKRGVYLSVLDEFRDLLEASWQLATPGTPA